MPVVEPGTPTGETICPHQKTILSGLSVGSLQHGEITPAPLSRDLSLAHEQNFQELTKVQTADRHEILSPPLVSLLSGLGTSVFPLLCDWELGVLLLTLTGFLSAEGNEAKFHQTMQECGSARNPERDGRGRPLSSYPTVLLNGLGLWV